jgi:3-hydroxybutyrate dehydrogenase
MEQTMSSTPSTGQSLSGKTALVTGSTSGIGLGIARALAAQGANIVFNGFGDAAEIAALLAATAREFGVRTDHHNADMSKAAEIEALFAHAAGHFGGIDVLVNNAGIQFVANVEEFPVEKWDAIIAINLTSAFHTASSTWPRRTAWWARPASPPTWPPSTAWSALPR